PDTVYEVLPPLPDGERTYGKQKVVVIEGTEPDYIEETPVEKKEEPVYVAETPAAEEVVSEEAVASELPAGIESEPVVVAEEQPVSSEEPADAYQPIVLVPAEPNPPLAEESPARETVPVVVEVAPVKEVVPVEETAPAVVIENNWTNYVVPSVKNLRKGSYYIQVASLGNTDNIKNFIDKYSAKYPVVLVQNSSKSSYQVMVGPLNIDEYGAVDEKFRAHGFKDAFVRKIK
ncbi:MAG: SPOR domain-containing protein, partial [Treponema sp.]|nr:SPOR domain-containing protein [Treponema sp.]